MRARRLLEGSGHGSERSLFRGDGVELAEIRPYQPGDDYRSIDWNVTARAGRPHVKRMEEERELPLLLAVDASGSLGFGTGERTKRELAAEVAAVLGLAALREGHPVGDFLFTDRVEGGFVAPSRSRDRFRGLTARLASPVRGDGTDLAGALRAANALTDRRCVVTVVTDLVEPGSFGGELDRLRRRHDILFVEVRDAVDDRLPDVGLLPVRDPESGRVGMADLASARVRDRFARGAGDERERAHRELERQGVDRISVRTDREYATDLAALFRARDRRRR